MREWPSDREPTDCARLRRSPLLSAYLDGELPVADTLRVQFHLNGCPICGHAAAAERALRRRLRQELPRVTPSGELRERVRREVLRADRKERTARFVRPFVWGTLASAALIVLVFWGLRFAASEPDLVTDLVSTHVLYSRLEVPAELASGSRLEVAGWIHRNLALPVPVPDFSQAGLRLVGARLASHAEHPMAHLFYEKGRALLSLYVLPASGLSLPRGGRMDLDGHQIVVREASGHQVLVGRSGRFIFALVSTLDRDDLIECARAFFREGGQRKARAKAESAGISERRLVLSVWEPSGSINPYLNLAVVRRAHP